MYEAERKLRITDKESVCVCLFERKRARDLIMKRSQSCVCGREGSGIRQVVTGHMYLNFCVCVKGECVFTADFVVFLFFLDFFAVP